MAAPSVSGLTSLQELDFSANGTAMVAASGALTFDTDRKDRMHCDVTLNDTEWYEISFTSSQDLTGKSIVFAFYNRIRYKSGTFRVGLFSISNTDYRLWQFEPVRFRQIAVILDAEDFASEAADTGTFDVTSVVGIRFQWVSFRTDNHVSASGIEWGQENNNSQDIFSLPNSGLTLSEGESGNLSELNDIGTYLSGNGFLEANTTGFHQLFGESLLVGFPITLGGSATLNLITSFKNLVFLERSTASSKRAIFPSPYKLDVDTTNATTIDRTVLSSESSNFSFLSNRQTNSLFIDSPTTVELAGGTTIEISSPTDTVSGGEAYSGLNILDSTAGIAFAPSSTAAFAGDNKITGTPDHAFSFESGNGWTDGDSVNLSSFDLSSVTPGTNMFRVDIGSSAEFTVTVPIGSGLTASDVTAVNGETVTVQEPQATTAISGFPSANNTNGVAPNPVLGIYDASIGATPAGYLAGLETSDAEYSRGTYTINAGDYAGSLASGTEILVVGDAVGWRRTAAIAIDTSDPPATLDLSPAFDEFLDEAGVAFIGASAACSGLNYNQSDARFELDSASGGASSLYNFAGVATRQEELTSNLTGLQNFETSVIRAIQYISNDSYRRIILPNSLSVAAAEAAETSPIISDFALLRDDNTDPFDHGLSSTASGLTDRPEVLIRFQAPNSNVNVASIDTDAITAEAIAADAIAEINATVDAALTDYGANTTAPDNSTIAAIASNVSDIIADIADMQGTGFVSADHSLEAIRDRGDAAWITATGFNTTTPPTAAAIASQVRTELTIELARIDANITSRQATVTFPSNFSLLAIDGSGQVTAENMRGTDGANTIAPDNAAISTILIDTGTMLPAQISALNNLAIADVETALSNYDAPVYATLQTYGDTNWATATGFSTFDGDLSGIPAAVWGYSGRALDGSQATAIALIDTINTNVSSCLSAAEAVTDGRFVENYTASTAIQYDTDGTVRTVFDLLDANGDPAISAQTAVERRPQ